MIHYEKPNYRNFADMKRIYEIYHAIKRLFKFREAVIKIEYRRNF